MLQSSGSQRGVLGLLSQGKLLHGWSRVERVTRGMARWKAMEPAHTGKMACMAVSVLMGTTGTV